MQKSSLSGPVLDLGLSRDRFCSAWVALDSEPGRALNRTRLLIDTSTRLEPRAAVQDVRRHRQPAATRRWRWWLAIGWLHAGAGRARRTGVGVWAKLTGRKQEVVPERTPEPRWVESPGAAVEMTGTTTFGVDEARALFASRGQGA